MTLREANKIFKSWQDYMEIAARLPSTMHSNGSFCFRDKIYKADRGRESIDHFQFYCFTCFLYALKTSIRSKFIALENLLLTHLGLHYRILAYLMAKPETERIYINALGKDDLPRSLVYRYEEPGSSRRRIDHLTSIFVDPTLLQLVVTYSTPDRSVDSGIRIIDLGRVRSIEIKDFSASTRPALFKIRR